MEKQHPPLDSASLVRCCSLPFLPPPIEFLAVACMIYDTYALVM